MNSRELDEKVALLLGHGVTEGSDFMRVEHFGVTLLARYSTDYACVPEQLAWLRAQHGSDIAFQFFTIRMRADGVWTAFCILPVGKQSMPLEAHGATIPEALSRLVVAVAEVKEAGK